MIFWKFGKKEQKNSASQNQEVSNSEREIILLTLLEDQVLKAKECNGERKKITHAVICEPFGRIFGTEKHCLKYYLAWKNIFSDLFPKNREMTNYEITNYNTTFNLANILIQAQEK